MGIFFIYSIKVALCLAAFYLFYKLLLCRETFFGFNRAALLSMTALSLVLPLVHVETAARSAAVGGFVIVEDAVIGAVADGATGVAVSVAQVCFAIYVAGVVFFLLREVWSLLSLRRLMASGRVADRDGGVRTIVVGGDVSPFSWFGNIIISERDWRDGAREILAHERAHIAGRHSVDILLCDLLIVFQWFNPAAWLIKAELQNIHEYMADSAVLDGGADAAGYQMLLIRKAVGDRLFSMANNLNQCSLKKRITMMMKRKSNPWNRARTLLALPVAAVAVVAFATPKAESLSNEIKTESDALVSRVVPAVAQTVKAAPAAAQSAPGEIVAVRGGAYDVTEPVQTAESPQAGPDDEVYDVVENQPQFPGGSEAMMKFLRNTIKYPEAAAKAGIKGRVIAQFIIATDGTVTDPKIMRSVSPELDEEALRVIRAMPKWTPGTQNGKAVAVRYTIPITFSMDSPSAADIASRASASVKSKTNGEELMVITGNSASDKDMLVVINGKVATTDDLKALKVDEIKSMEIFKDAKNTVDKYGDAARNGVIQVTLRDK